MSRAKYRLPETDFALYPSNARSHQSERKHKWRENESALNDHLELGRLATYLSKLSGSNHSTDFGFLLHNLETNPHKIKTWQENSLFVSQHKDLEDTLASVEPVEFTISRDFGAYDEDRSPIAILLDYEQNVDIILEGLKPHNKLPTYLHELKKQMLLERELIDDLRTQTTSQYSLRADLNFNVVLRKETSSRVDKYNITLNPDSVVQAYDEKSRKQKTTKVRKSKRMQRNELSVFDQTIRDTEVAKGVTTALERICKDNNIKLARDDESTLNAIIHIEQESIDLFNIITQYELDYKGNTYEQSTKGRTALAVPFVHALKGQEGRDNQYIFESVVRRAKYFNKMFYDLKTLCAHGSIARGLISLHKGEFPTVTQQGDEYIRLPKMRCPSLALKKKRNVPNGVKFGKEQHMAILTGANANGKSTYAIGIAQNVILAQAGFPIFAKNATIIPRDRILCKFPDYDGNFESGESRHSADCIEIKDLIERIKPNSLVLLDEMGTGTSPSDAKEMLTYIYQALDQLKGPVVLSSTHYFDLVKELESQLPHTQALAFNFNGRNQPTYKATPGVATTSEGVLIAKRKGLSSKDLERLVKTWKKEGMA